MLVPQDDVLEFDPKICECEFTPYEDSDEESWHYLRRCPECKTTWYSLHCRCEQPHRLCGSCKQEKK